MVDCNHPVNVRDEATSPKVKSRSAKTCVEASCCLRKSKENPLKRKKMDVSQEELEPRTKKRPGKRRRTWTEESHEKTEKTGNGSEASCPFTRREIKKNSMKRKRMDVSQEELEPRTKERPGKRRRTWTEESHEKTEKTGNGSEASCCFTRREIKKNSMKRKRMDDEGPALQPEETPEKRRRTWTEESHEKTEKTENGSEASCSFARREIQKNSLKRKRMDDEGPALQPEETLEKRRRTETEENDVNREKTENGSEASCSFARREIQENSLNRKRMDDEGPEVQPEETPEKRSRTETEEKGTQTVRRINLFRIAKLPVYYIMGGLLGKGAFGVVFAGVRKIDGRKVAIKIELREDDAPFITIPGDTRRLPLEVALLELVCKPPHCPYVIKLLEWFETPKYFILVLERPEPCIDLYKYCRCLRNSLSENQVKIIMEKVVWAALHCHERGVFHRDIKEENILLNPQTLEVKLIDFGCGDLLKDMPYTNYSGTILFSPPEYFIAHKYKAEPATVWGLGVLLYSLLCGEEPFNNYLDTIKGELYLPDDLSEDSCSLIKRCLEQDPERRANLEEVITHDWFYRTTE